jgi:hypothetical protein
VFRCDTLNYQTIQFSFSREILLNQEVLSSNWFLLIHISSGVEFIKVGGHGIKRRSHRKSGRQCKNARCQIRVNLFKKDGRRAQISSVGCNLLYEIHPRTISCTLIYLFSKHVGKLLEESVGRSISR